MNPKVNVKLMHLQKIHVTYHQKLQQSKIKEYPSNMRVMFLPNRRVKFHGALYCVVQTKSIGIQYFHIFDKTTLFTFPFYFSVANKYILLKCPRYLKT